MKKISAFLTLFVLVNTAILLSSCGVSNKSLSQYDDMYYSPSAAKKQALIDEKSRQKELQERQKYEVYSSNESGSIQGSSNYTENSYGDNTIVNNYYGTDSRMDYGGYFNRFGVGYYGYTRNSASMAFNPMLMYSPYSFYGSGINMSYGVGNWRLGVSYGNSYYRNSFYDPFWGMGTPYYNPFMYSSPYGMYNPYYMGGFGSNYYDMGYMNGYMMGASMGNSGYWNSGGSTISKSQPIVRKRDTYGTNQRAGTSQRNSISGDKPQSVTTGGGVNPSTTNRGATNRSTTTRQTTTTPSRSATPSRTTTPSKSSSGSYNSGSSGSRSSGSSGTSHSSGSSSRGGKR